MATVQTSEVLYTKLSRYNSSGNEDGYIMEDYKKMNVPLRRRLFVMKRRITQSCLHSASLGMHVCGGFCAGLMDSMTQTIWRQGHAFVFLS